MMDQTMPLKADDTRNYPDLTMPLKADSPLLQEEQDRKALHEIAGRTIATVSDLVRALQDIERLNLLSEFNLEVHHIADDLLLDFIGNKDVTAAYGEIVVYYE